MNKITLLLSFIVLSCHAQPNPNDVTLQEKSLTTLLKP
jgi:hypothetical protein